VPWIGVFGAPYIYRDEAQMANIIKGPIFAKMKKDLLEKLNIRILDGALFYGWRYLTTRDTPVYSVEDVKGLKLRVPGGKVHLDMERAWGAAPTPMNFGELYLALSQGVIDGQDNPLTMIDSAKFYEVQKYLIATKHMNNVRFFLINEDVFQKLSPEQQRIFEEAAKEAIDWNNKIVQEDENKLLTKLQEKGMTLIIPDVESFKKATMKIFPEYEDIWGEGVVEEIMNTP
jgi:tripartite ATP-independent transporter DctP family solute receptor